MQIPLLEANFAPFFYTSSMLLILILQVHEIVEQREKGTLSLLTLAGLWYAIFSSIQHEDISSLNHINSYVQQTIILAITDHHVFQHLCHKCSSTVPRFTDVPLPHGKASGLRIY